MDRPSPLITAWLEAPLPVTVGAPLTRQEMNIAFRILFERMKNFRFAEGRNDFQHQGNFMVRALKHLHITFEKR